MGTGLQAEWPPLTFPLAASQTLDCGAPSRLGAPPHRPAQLILGTSGLLLSWVCTALYHQNGFHHGICIAGGVAVSMIEYPVYEGINQILYQS
ncbi:mCG147160 [Mus musculus]|nr:mCG147160 [Mus musculus]